MYSPASKLDSRLHGNNNNNDAAVIMTAQPAILA